MTRNGLGPESAETEEELLRHGGQARARREGSPPSSGKPVLLERAQPRRGVRHERGLRPAGHGLERRGGPGPYVLVGHSLGGLYARLYAKRFPSEVTGLVLLDPTTRTSSTTCRRRRRSSCAIRLAESNRTKHRLYTHLATTRPRTEVRRLDDAGHSGIAWLRPDAVVQAIRDTPTRY
ncbi:alpha/beta hydrolase [Allokutzneria sp. A3M-2-11 16]|uniref:alpha/beta hydrolase n=1 Tax=Allokutzneria sp. A3M-2-11 16 TaxID=2962043 RepID=UPI0020B86D61|nr:alpha/beta fold hydrolase [Allokutzneria sp. A3M-2-11 16]MCP3805059.1 alpha/beta hydrolase [Allokutzneria sp. A3M-2-11 16]